MEIGMRELSRIYRSNHCTSLQYNKGLEGYIVPRTLLRQDQVGSFQESQIENKTKEEKYSIGKGFKFDKAKRNTDKSKEKQMPGPTTYFLKGDNRGKQSLKINVSSAFRKYPRFDQSKPNPIGVGDYNINSNPVQKDKPRSVKGSLSKAVTASYFQQAMQRSTLVPGPGWYDLKDKNRCKSQYESNNFKKHVSLDKLNNKRPVYKHQIGPTSYMIPRSTSQTCSVKMRANYKQIDPRLTLGLQKMKKQKKDSIKTGPGKYLRIDEWCKYQNNKKVPTALTILAKPSPPRIYA